MDSSQFHSLGDDDATVGLRNVSFAYFSSDSHELRPCKMEPHILRLGRLKIKDSIMQDESYSNKCDTSIQERDLTDSCIMLK